jgi:hypothetical protein
MSGNFFYNALLNFYKIEKSKDQNFFDDLNTQKIGYYDTEKKIWYHAWAIYGLVSTNDPHKKSKELLSYVLNIERDLKGISEVEKMIIKSMISNGKIYVPDQENDSDFSQDNNLQINLLLAVICYLIKAKKIASYTNNNIIVYAVQV